MPGQKRHQTTLSEQPLLSETQTPHQQPQYVFVIPPFTPPTTHRLLRKSCRRCLISCATIFIFLAAAVYLLWPSDPDLSIVRLKLDNFQFHMDPKASLDVTMNLTVRVHNQDLHSISYDSLLVTIGYRGKRLGDVTSEGGNITARATSYINATLQLERVEILSDLILLMEDLAKGEIKFDTETHISGLIRVFFFDLPVKMNVPCEVTVDTHNNKVSHQSCYPEIAEVQGSSRI